MAKNPVTDPDDAPELDAAFFQRARPARQVLTETQQGAFRPRSRGPQKAPTKRLVTLRLSPEVLDFFRAGGAGWQSRLDEALREHVAARRHG